MRTQSPDTHPDIERKQIEIMRGFSPARKFEIVANLTDSAAHINSFYRQDLSNRIKLVYGQQWLRRYRTYRQKHPDMVPTTIDIAASVLLAIASLERRSIRFALAGRIACAFYGLPSTLRSIELRVDYPRHLHLSSYHSRIGDSSLDMQHYTLIEITRSSAQLDRAQWLPLIRDHQPIPLLAPEDVTLDLLDRFATTGRRDDALYNDLLGMIKVQSPRLNLAYLTNHVTTSNASLLKQLLIDGGILP